MMRTGDNFLCFKLLISQAQIEVESSLIFLNGIQIIHLCWFFNYSFIISLSFSFLNYLYLKKLRLGLFCSFLPFIFFLKAARTELLPKSPNHKDIMHERKNNTRNKDSIELLLDLSFRTLDSVIVGNLHFETNRFLFIFDKLSNCFVNYLFDFLFYILNKQIQLFFLK